MQEVTICRSCLDKRSKVLSRLAKTILVIGSMGVEPSEIVRTDVGVVFAAFGGIFVDSSGGTSGKSSGLGGRVVLADAEVVVSSRVVESSLVSSDIVVAFDEVDGRDVLFVVAACFFLSSLFKGELEINAAKAFNSSFFDLTFR